MLGELLGNLELLDALCVEVEGESVFCFLALRCVVVRSLSTQLHASTTLLLYVLQIRPFWTKQLPTHLIRHRGLDVDFEAASVTRIRGR